MAVVSVHYCQSSLQPYTSTLRHGWLLSVYTIVSHPSSRTCPLSDTDGCCQCTLLSVYTIVSHLSSRTCPLRHGWLLSVYTIVSHPSSRTHPLSDTDGCCQCTLLSVYTIVSHLSSCTRPLSDTNGYCQCTLLSVIPPAVHVHSQTLMAVVSVHYCQSSLHPYTSTLKHGWMLSLYTIVNHPSSRTRPLSDTDGCCQCTLLSIIPPAVHIHSQTRMDVVTVHYCQSSLQPYTSTLRHGWLLSVYTIVNHPSSRTRPLSDTDGCCHCTLLSIIPPAVHVHSQTRMAVVNVHYCQSSLQPYTSTLRHGWLLSVYTIVNHTSSRTRPLSDTDGCCQCTLLSIIPPAVHVHSQTRMDVVSVHYCQSSLQPYTSTLRHGWLLSVYTIVSHPSSRTRPLSDTDGCCQCTLLSVIPPAVHVHSQTRMGVPCRWNKTDKPKTDRIWKVIFHNGVSVSVAVKYLKKNKHLKYKQLFLIRTKQVLSRLAVLTLMANSVRYSSKNITCLQYFTSLRLGGSH